MRISKTSDKQRRVEGHHFLVDLFGVERGRLSDAASLSKALTRAARDAGIRILAKKFHRFPDGGVTGFLLLATSHISVHTWPHEGFAALDVYSCSGLAATKAARAAILRALPHEKACSRSVRRAYTFPNELDFFASPILATGEIQRILVTARVAAVRSRFQKIELFDTADFGRCLALDGLLQTAESDHHLYDREMLRPLRPSDRKLLILGGGDGYVAAAALRKNPSLRITLVERDPRVMALARQHFHHGVFSAPHLTVKIADGFRHLNHDRSQYDGIVCDLTDPPGSTQQDGDTDQIRRLLNRALRLCSGHTRDGGWACFHGGAAHVLPGTINVATLLEQILPKHFRTVQRCNVMIPSYGEKIAFFAARK